MSSALDSVNPVEVRNVFYDAPVEAPRPSYEDLERQVMGYRKALGEYRKVLASGSVAVNAALQSKIAKQTREITRLRLERDVLREHCNALETELAGVCPAFRGSRGAV